MVTPIIRLSLLSFCLALATSWPQWGGPDRDFVVPGKESFGSIPEAGLTERWRLDLGRGTSGLCAANGNLYTLYHRDGREFVVALSGKDGSKLWERSFSVSMRGFMDLEFGPGPHSTPLLTEDRLFCIGITGNLRALDPGTGKTVWERDLWAGGEGTPLERGFASSPVAFEDSILVAVGGDGHAIQCLAMENGSVRWRRHGMTAAYASPLIATLAGKPHAVFLMDQQLVGVDPGSGDLLWSHPVVTERYVNCTSPTVGPGSWIYINTSRGMRGYEVFPYQGETRIRERWVNRAMGCQTGNFVLRDGILYGAREGGSFTAIEAATGETLWRSRSLAECVAVVTGDRLVAVEEDGELVVARATRDRVDVLYRKKLLEPRSWTGPVISDGSLYLRDEEKVIAFDLPAAE